MTVKETVKAATRPYVNMTLNRKQIVALTQELDSSIPESSILPSDLAGANSKGNVYGDQLFSRVSGGYFVLPTDQIVAKPSSSTRSRETLAEALAAAKALLAAHSE